MTRDDLELRYDGPIPPAMLEQARRSKMNPRYIRRLELESIVAISESELLRIKSQLSMARQHGHGIRRRFLEIEYLYHRERSSLAAVLLEREEFGD